MVNDPAMVVKYWGVRGSVPSPLTHDQILEKQTALIRELYSSGGLEATFGKKPTDEEILKKLLTLPPSLSSTYGGDTTCVEIQAKDSPLIIIDAGTGIRHLGRELLGRLLKGQNLNPLNTCEETKRDIHILFTHFHWDHLQGFPFFAPGFMSGKFRVNLHLYGRRDAKQRLTDVLAGQQECPNFPVLWDDMPCQKISYELRRMSKETISIGKAMVNYQELTHPDAVFAYSVEVEGKKFVFATDTEHKDIIDPRLTNLCKGCQILYYDSQYTPDDYVGTPGGITGSTPKIDWGHSTYEWGVKTVLRANVPTLVLGHHEPVRNDFQLEELLGQAKDYLAKQLAKPEFSSKKVEILLARQGLEQKLF
ncbi:MAG: MBL fold metallo-hydrolase [Candidatus Riflebacteria bacterium]|nr:MBL fold metallo-hydrolase [Candidatus Riflebacteria bacterium]